MASKPTTKKASVTTEIVLGQAAQQLSKVVAELKSATETISDLASKSEDLTLQVANKEEAIASLDVQYAEKARQADVDLELSMKANTEKVVNEHLSSIGKVSISKTDLVALQKELADTKANADAETKKQVAIVASTLKAQYENEIKLIHSENKSTAAENASQIGVLKEKNTFLEGQVAKMYQQMDAERSASIERAKAGSVGSINVTSDRK